MKNLKFYLSLLILFSNLNISAIEIESLKCEFAENPLWIESSHPHLSWVLSSTQKGDKQTAYEIRVASSPELLKSESSDYWNSGKVLSDKSQYISYSGKALSSDTRYYWMVRVWDINGNPSSWSSINMWNTTLNDKDWNAKWIGAIHQKDAHLPKGNIYHTPGLKKELAALWDNVAPLAKKSILLRKEFTIDKGLEDAKIYISGLGQYDLYINGKQVDNSVFKPIWSEYNKTIYYNTFDISEFLQEGKNVIGVMLGNGMYNVNGGRYTKLRISFGPPTLLLQANISYNTGKKQQVVSDETWKYELSPITFNCIFGGEDYDANLEKKDWSITQYNDNDWKSVVIQDVPVGKLRAQSAPLISVSKVYHVKEFKETMPNKYFFDMGQNLSGYPTIKVKGKKGQKVKLIIGDVINKEKNGINQGQSGSPYSLEYTLKGNGIEEWTPSFTYYGYQYIVISDIDYKKAKKGSDRPLLLDVKSNFIHLSAADDGHFECSNELFNRIHFIIDKSTRSNMQSTFTDCPHREKLGWLEETHLNGPGLLFNYDMRNFFPKLLQDIEDSQLDNGLITSVVPEYAKFDGGFRDSPEWGSAGVIVPWMYYEWYGDNSLIEKYYPTMRRYVDYLTSKSKDYILSHGLGDWYDYDPKEVGKSQNTPIEITATGHYYMVADLLAKSAKMLNNSYDEKTYSDLAKKIENAYNTKLFNPDTAQYGSGSQCSNAMPLFLGIVPEEYQEKVLANLISDIKGRGNRLSTGDVGNRYLYQALAMNGQNELMYLMHNHRDVPGYGFQVEYGVTALTENWDPRRGASWNHFMMGQIEEWFYKSLGGIKPDINNPGFKHFFIEPQIVGDITSVNTSYNSMYGKIKTDWKIQNGQFLLKVDVPVNTTATLILPLGENQPVKLESGEHSFSIKL